MNTLQAIQIIILLAMASVIALIFIGILKAERDIRRARKEIEEKHKTFAHNENSSR